MTVMEPSPSNERRNVRRNAVLLALLAATFYLGFILTGYLRSQGGG